MNRHTSHQSSNHHIVRFLPYKSKFVELKGYTVVEEMDRGGGGRDYRGGGGGGGGGGRRDRSPPRSRYSRRRSRSIDRRRSARPPAEDASKLRDMLLAEAAKKNPEAASVLQSAAADQESLQRALATANALNVGTSQQQLAASQGMRPGGGRPFKPK